MDFKLNSEGKFNILIISDIQECRKLSKEHSKRLFDIISKLKPELVVLLGDMIFGQGVFRKERAESVIESVLKPIEDAGVPFAYVFGNHDGDSFVSKAFQETIYQKSDLCVTPPLGMRDCFEGYRLTLYDESGNVKVAEFFFTDSGATGFGRYGITYNSVKPSTVDWMERSLKENKDVPAYLFQHVPVFSIYRLLKVDDSKGAVRCHGPFKGMRMVLNEDLAQGILGEAPCPPWDVSDEEFKVLKDSKRVKAMIFGHDHVNAFTGNLDGISVLQTSCAGLNCYGNDNTRGVRLLTVSRDGKLDTSMLFFV